MSEQEFLKKATSYFKQAHPALSPEAVIAFLVIVDAGTPTVEDVSLMLGMPEALLSQHLATMFEVGGAGLIRLQPVMGGGNSITLTPSGVAARDGLMAVLES